MKRIISRSDKVRRRKKEEKGKVGVTENKKCANRTYVNKTGIDKKDINKKWIDKKGIELWISWVLITAFMVAMGTFIYRWAADYAKSSASDIEVRASSAECDYAAIEITSACQSESVIYVNVANKKGLKIDKIIFSLYDIFGNGESREKTLALDVGKDVNVEILKQGTISTIGAIPAIQKNSRWIICPEREIEYSNISYC